MAEPDWTLIETVLRELQADMAAVKGTLAQHGAKLDAIEKETRGLRDLSKMALGAGTGAEYLAEQAQQAADRANKRLDELTARIEALEDAH
jgi:chromosome segregation ATPase